MKERDLYRTMPKPDETCLWELKLCKTKSIPFAALKPHQKDALLTSKIIGTWYKFPDTGVQQMPCDGFYIKKAEVAYVIVLFYEPRKKKDFYFIEIEDWVSERERSKSLTKARAEEICRYKKSSK